MSHTMPLAHRSPITVVVRAFAAGWQQIDADARRAGYVDGLHGAQSRPPVGADMLDYALGYQAGTRDRPCCGTPDREG